MGFGFLSNGNVRGERSFRGCSGFNPCMAYTLRPETHANDELFSVQNMIIHSVAHNHHNHYRVEINYCVLFGLLNIKYAKQVERGLDGNIWNAIADAKTHANCILECGISIFSGFHSAALGWHRFRQNFSWPLVTWLILLCWWRIGNFMTGISTIQNRKPCDLWREIKVVFLCVWWRFIFCMEMDCGSLFSSPQRFLCLYGCQWKRLHCASTRSIVAFITFHNSSHYEFHLLYYYYYFLFKSISM